MGDDRRHLTTDLTAATTDLAAALTRGGWIEPPAHLDELLALPEDPPMIDYPFPLSPHLLLSFRLPATITRAQVERITRWLNTLPLPED